MIAIAGSKVLFSIHDKELSGQMAAIVSGSFAMFIAGYANQIMLQFPNAWLFFGNLSLVALAEEMERQLNADRARKYGELMEQELQQAQQSIYPLEAIAPTVRPLDIASKPLRPLEIKQQT